MNKIDYQKRKIYKIESHLRDKIYIGSTTNEYLCQRMRGHRKNYNQWKKENRDLTTSFILFEEYGIDNCEIILIEAYPCNSKDELKSREAHYIKTIKCVNKCIPGRTSKQYDIDNKDRIQQRKLKYYEDTKDKQLEYYHTNKEQISERRKIHYEKNKEVIKEKARQYRALKKQQS